LLADLEGEIGTTVTSAAPEAASFCTRNRFRLENQRHFVKGGEINLIFC